MPDPPPPDDGAAVHLSPGSSVAGGVPAIVATMRELATHTGLIRGARALHEVNQAHGFDCPGCAWPEPADDRSALEFCENGVKAIASEATRARIDASFFARHSLADLAARSDHWL